MREAGRPEAAGTTPADEGSVDISKSEHAPPPFGHLRPAVAVAAAYGVAVVAWLAGGDVLPGGRWLAVHLFTLGVLSNLILALTHHFAQTLLKAPPGSAAGRRFVLFNAGALLVLTFPASWRGPLALGAVLVTAAVFWLYLDLRRMRRRSLGSRFIFVVRAYERACSAFMHGALLGMLLGIGVLGGAWYGAVRLAHLHVQILGWGGLVLLATVVFFGPTVMRTRIEPGADRTAAPALRYGATALTVSVVALIVTGAGDPYALPARLLAAIGLAGYATAATVICLPVLKAARRSGGNVHGRLIGGACVWFPITIWAGVGLVATERWVLLDALGASLLIGVLAQAIIGALGYLAPMVWTGGAQARSAARAQLERLPRVRLAVHNAAALAVVAGVVGRRLLDLDLGGLVTAGLLLLAASILGHVALGLQATRIGRTAEGA
jgi:hypothetical protein